ncbi:ion transporter [Winogradskyella litorisediminis]|uniref:Ion transporter n=1 Tax=Winogradskyella litorisediminis TaxID=1156618 RepID=A0ABW3N848_9FLAO
MKKIIDGRDTTLGRAFDIFIQILIIFSIITFSIETLPDLKPHTREILHSIEVICVIIFTAEYLARIYIADKKLKFIFSFFGLIDFFAILPFYLTFGLDLRSLRIFRLLRLFRLLKLVRYNRAMQHFGRAMIVAKEQIILFMSITLILIYFAATGIYYFEHEAQPEKFASIFDSLWWSIVTLTTVGYGDVYPVTMGGRLFTFFILLIGLGIVAIPTGIISSSMTKVFNEKHQELKESGEYDELFEEEE